MRKRLPVLAMVALATAASAQAPQPVVAIVGATLVDGTGAAPIPDAVILIRDGRILDVGPGSSVRIPQGAARTEVKGKTILPGFVNAHGHANVTNGLQSGEEFNTRDNVERQVRLYADYGVTSVFSLGGDGAAGVAVRAAPAVGRGRLFIAGPDVSARTPEAAAAEVDALIAQKVDWVKVRLDDNLGAGQKIPREAVKAAIDRAHMAKIPVAAHIFYLDDAKYLLRNGIDLIGHSVRDLPVDAEFIQLAKQRDVCYVPTLMREVSTYVYESTPEFFSDPFFLRHADRATVEGLKAPARQQQVRTSKTAPRYKVALEQATRNLKTLSDAGVRIAMGTDTGPVGRFQGYFEHLELEMMVKAGLTPMQALVAATSGAARAMGLEEHVGTIQVGKAADLLVLNANPLADIRNTRQIHSVWIGGRQLANLRP